MIISAPALKEGYQARPCYLEDAPAVVELMNICSMDSIGEADNHLEELISEWKTPGFDLPASQRIVIAPDGRVVAWIEVWSTLPVVPHMDLYVHPDFRSEGIGEYLLEWSLSRARECIALAPENARVAMRADLYQQDVWYRALYETVGLQIIRHYYRMEIDLQQPLLTPTSLPGITIRNYTPADDLRAILHVNRDSFQDHFGYIDQPFEQHYTKWLHEWQGDSPIEPDLWFLALDGDYIVGILLGKPHQQGDADMGWISTVGVRRDYRRRGIAKALLLHAFQAFRHRGKKRVGLGVDASSITGATEVYRQVGMEVTVRFDSFELELRGGVDLSRQDNDGE